VVVGLEVEVEVEGEEEGAVREKRLVDVED
jgi:hypothetical protein